MAEKKVTTKKAAAPKATATKAAAPKAAAPKKAAAKKVEVVINAENVGFRAGDVYQALAAAEKAMKAADIAKAAKITTEEAYLGIGWLFKEGKVKADNNLIALA
ncbi:MAG: winged helix-turn-helix domain-containing protein [Prevotella sp.]|nr:winged helix-turn-helix domain-containing protein [Prevotella sp.]